MANSALRFVTIGLKSVSGAGAGVGVGSGLSSAKRDLVGLLLPNGGVLDLAADMRRGGKLDGLAFGALHNNNMLSFLRATEKRPDIIESFRNKLNQNSYDIEDVHCESSFILQPPGKLLHITYHTIIPLFILYICVIVLVSILNLVSSFEKKTNPYPYLLSYNKK